MCEKFDLTLNNPAAPFGTNDAGGIEKSRDRALSLAEIREATKIFRKHMDRFGMDNYIAAFLYLVLGVRKIELTEAPWNELDLVKAEWEIPDEWVKKGKGIYDHYDYYEERRQAHQKLADVIEPLVWYDLM